MEEVEETIGWNRENQLIDSRAVPMKTSVAAPLLRRNMAGRFCLG
jgi:hypothetical protein